MGAVSSVRDGNPLGTASSENSISPEGRVGGDSVANNESRLSERSATEPRLSLRTRLIFIATVVTAVGLVVAGGVTYLSLRAFLLERVDEQLAGARFPAAVALAVPGDAQTPPFAPPESQPGGPRAILPPGTYGQLLSGDGAVIDTIAFSYGSEAAPPPDLPTDISSIASTDTGPAAAGDPVTVGAQGGGGPDYRVLVTKLPALDRFVVVAVPLTQVNDTLTRLLVVELIVSLIVLAALAVTIWFLVRRELRPLEAMAADAAAIADGDLSRRVSPSGQRTEVGRLGSALNTMLGQIERAFAESRASEERLRRFLADASHELRTPLTSIRGYAELFRRGADQDPDDLALAMRRIEDEGGRMGVIVDDLLLLARLDQDRPLEREPVDLVTLAEDAVADARAADASRAISLVAPEEVVVTGDEARLRQALANLLGNALAHTPAGTPVHVTLTRPVPEAAAEVGPATAADARPDPVETAAYAVLTVRDEGPGIAAADLERVFEPFHRGADAVDDESGAGLGLAIVAAVVKAHGGTVSAASELGGRDATFTVRLPLARVEPRADTPQERRHAGSKRPRRRRDCGHVRLPD